MKKQISILILAAGLSLWAPMASRAQSFADCIQQLALDYQKLAGLKSILSQMYTGYSVLSKGYGAVKELSQGNFTLHEAFLDGLYIVSPAVRKYPRVGDIINDQSRLIAEYKYAAAVSRQGGAFSPDELAYQMDVYNNLVNASLKNLDDLSLVLSDSKMRMSDAERLTAIDRIYADSRNELNYLRKFNSEAEKMAQQRARSAADQKSVKGLYGIQN